MKILRKTASAPQAVESRIRGQTTRHQWKLLVVDDEPDVLAVTRLSLRDFTFAGRSLEIIDADSAATARDRLAEHPDVALALIDVVMDTDDAGLRLVEHIRNSLGNQFMRVMIRTGQPGVAPERYVIDHYDIDDYKEKTELSTNRLYTSVRAGIKAYRDLMAINMNRRGLERILDVTPTLFDLGNDSLHRFFSGVLTQIIGLCQLSQASHVGTLEGVITTIDQGEAKVHAYTGHFADIPRFKTIHDACVHAIQTGRPAAELREHSQVLPLLIGQQPIGYIYIEPVESLSSDDLNLIQILARQCSHALENFKLHENIVDAFDNAIDMLAEIAEFKDKATGDHINRIDRYTRFIARAMGLSEAEANVCGTASRLHDVGKIGIPDHILSKPGKLTPEEFGIIKTHTNIGASILSHDRAFDMARDVALYHHERWEGGGYPEGVPSRKFALVTRMVSVADVFDALVNRRPYKAPWEIPDARQAIADGSGTQFDPDVVNAFLSQLDQGCFDAIIDLQDAA